MEIKKRENAIKCIIIAFRHLLMFYRFMSSIDKVRPEPAREGHQQILWISIGNISAFYSIDRKVYRSQSIELILLFISSLIFFCVFVSVYILHIIVRQYLHLNDIFYLYFPLLLHFPNIMAYRLSCNIFLPNYVYTVHMGIETVLQL